MEPRYHATVDGNLLSRVSLLRFVRAFAKASEIPPGYVLEFGVLNGTSLVEIWGILRGQITHLHGFDSFDGLPELSEQDQSDLPLMPAFDTGNFRSLSRAKVADWIKAASTGIDDGNLSLHEGFYEKSLPAFDKSRLAGQGPCLLAHVDCDLYSSSRDVFWFLDDLVTTGTWLLLDDYWCYRGSPHHGQRRAFEEWIAESSRIGATEYASYNGFSRAFILHEKETGSGES